MYFDQFREKMTYILLHPRLIAHDAIIFHEFSQHWTLASFYFLRCLILLLRGIFNNVRRDVRRNGLAAA